MTNTEFPRMDTNLTQVRDKRILGCSWAVNRHDIIESNINEFQQRFDRTMSIQAIFFDLGGVIVRTEDPAPRQQLAARLGMNAVELENLVFWGPQGQAAQLGQISAELQWLDVCRTVGWPPAKIPELQQAFFAGDRLDAGLVAFIHSLRPRYRTGLISNAISNLRHYLVEVWHIADAFDELVISSEVGIVKPEAGIYQLALRGLQAAPEQAVFIDDSLPNVTGAQAVGMQAIHFRNPEQMHVELEEILDEKR
jgi:HAD superfamily hydrolase (TIGR01509 family)